MYGLSETCGPSTLNNHLGFKLGSIGKVFLGCKLKIRDPDEDGNGEVSLSSVGEGRVIYSSPAAVYSFLKENVKILKPSKNKLTKDLALYN